MPLNAGIGALLAVATLVPATSLAAGIPLQVRVVRGSARVQRSCCAPAGVLAEVRQGATLDVLGKEQDWFWVILPQDGYGTRKGGWIRADDVEPFATGAAALAANNGEQDRPGEPPSAEGEGSAAEDKVIITERRDGTASDPAKAPGAATASAFEDVHFDRNRFALRPEDLNILRAAAAALKADPSMIVYIQGYTCNLGSAAYNLALGARRANAVKDYLVSEGIAADRLRTISMGEKNPKYDNSHEETRKLNRRVAVIPNAKP
jgi:outer membrane protein OmpA-like peptidoglycan-associated protein